MRRALLIAGSLALGCGGAAAGHDGSADGNRADTSADTIADANADTPPADTSGACNPAAVAFPQGGTLAPGTLCDELYACADDAAGAARIQAASPRFECTPGAEPQSTCTAFTCAYRNPGGPSTLDTNEIADICALTVLAPPPPLRCVIFVAAP
ncbi:MAG TPA: hypothetical protein VIQ54_27550 [Polyangia bacterium]|jgi:hypothetical protein